MKKAAVILGSALLLLAIGQTIFVSYLMSTSPQPGTSDQLRNINIPLTRAHNWRRVVDTPVIPEETMQYIDGSTATIPITAELLRQFYGYSDDAVAQSPYVHHSTTHTAYYNLVFTGIARRKAQEMGVDPEITSSSRLADLIFVTPPSEEELALASDQGVTLSLTPIALDGFVFITHRDNPIDSLTVEQIQGIYSGRITNWRELGGDDVPIRAFQREANSGSQTAMEQLVMSGLPMVTPPEVLSLSEMGELIDAVAEYDNAPDSLGYTYRYYIDNLYRNENIKVLKINGTSPDDVSIRSGAYPFTTSYYAVLRTDEPEGSPARTLRDFLLTETGQRVVEMAGYIGAVK